MKIIANGYHPHYLQGRNRRRKRPAMYVCLCNGYRSHEVREVAREGARSVDEAYLMLGDGPCCGRCIATAQAMIDEEHAARKADQKTKRRSSSAQFPDPTLQAALP
ncbi:(2Fe-2S)-binding protein [Limibacillus halophilus]